MLQNLFRKGERPFYVNILFIRMFWMNKNKPAIITALDTMKKFNLHHVNVEELIGVKKFMEP